jgi:two-component sensor histidine kinase
LIDELNHRVKNTLATVQSLAAQSLRERDPQLARRAFEGRLIALSRAHDVLTQGYWKSAALRQVVEEAVAAFDRDDKGQILREGPDVEVAPRVALALSMALHELLTNAVKHGALGVPEGRVEIRWRRVEEDGRETLQLTWRESGGPPVSAPTRRGFGTRLIESGLPLELGGRATLDFAPEGLVCVVSLSLVGAQGERASATPDGRSGPAHVGAGKDTRADAAE